ncbi:MAG: oxidoreductase [Pseudomonadota bacterium]
MTDQSPRDLHEGELHVQQLRHTPAELSAAIPHYIERNMPFQHVQFFGGLSYLPLATIDDQGRPWTSLLVTRSTDDATVGIRTAGQNRLQVVAKTNTYDPFVRALETQDGFANKAFAGVGINFTNRRRNKLAGAISSASVLAEGKVSLELATDQHLGNCPKYITVRSLRHQARDPELVLDSWEMPTAPLPDLSKSLIAQASTIFIATRHSAKGGAERDAPIDMGLNHRGGSPGFVRLYEDVTDDELTTYLVLPDLSGNRFYQSLGNIETDARVGLALPDFSTGDVLYVTGQAENLFDAKAEAIMPRVGLVTRIAVTGAVCVKAGLNLELTSEEELSPYNPPVRYLRSELAAMGHAAEPASDTDISAKLVSVQRLSEGVTTFRFELSDQINAPLPGGFGVFDFSKVLGAGYSHMNDAQPQAVNDDYVRTWTLSSAAEFDAGDGQFKPTRLVDVTVKRKQGGLVSTVLHKVAAHLAQGTEVPLEPAFKGTSVGFSCFRSSEPGAVPEIPAKMLWIAGGVGITPFMSMWSGILNVAKTVPDGAWPNTDIELLFACRGDDVNLLRHFLESADAKPKALSLSIRAYQRADHATDFPDSDVQIEERRLHSDDLADVQNLQDREVYLCGPDGMMNAVKSALGDLQVDASKIHYEAFQF